jgi:transcriptional regulator with GAF, ATPase, and Fis domain
VTATSFDLVKTMNGVARSIGSPRDVAKTLASIASAAAEAVPGVEHASVSVVDSEKQLQTLIPTDDFVAEADKLQCALGEGPCLDAALGEPVVRSDDLRREVRWPKYAPKAADMGVGAQLALHLYDQDHSYGGLNLYYGRPGSITTDSADIAELFAMHAALVMGHAREIESLKKALATRKVIGAAIGIIMERYELDEDRAFEFLVRVSQTGNVKLRAVAEEIVSTGNDRGRSKN